MPKKKSARRELTKRERELASKYIAQEVRTGKYSRAQAAAIGISKAKRKAKKKSTHH